MSFIIARFRHLALIMITLGFGFLLLELANSASWLTGGADGLQGVRMWPLFGLFKFDLWGVTSYWYSLIVLFLLFLVSRRLINSPFGLSLRGIRENVVRMRAIGAESRAHLQQDLHHLGRRSRASPAALLTQTTETVSLGVLDFQRSADILVILILGGAGRLYGGLIGAIIFMVARDQFSGINPQYWYFPIGVLLIAVVLFLPNGILGGLAQLVHIRARAAHGSAGSSSPCAGACAVSAPALSTRGLDKSFGSLVVAKRHRDRAAAAACATR